MDARAATRKNLVECWQEVKAPNGRRMHMDYNGDYIVDDEKRIYYWGRSFTQADAHLMKGVNHGR